MLISVLQMLKAETLQRIASVSVLARSRIVRVGSAKRGRVHVLSSCRAKIPRISIATDSIFF